jgi:hypothetical protein
MPLSVLLLNLCVTIYTLVTLYTTNEYYHDSLSKSIELMKFVNAFKCFAIKSLLEVGHVPPLLFMLCYVMLCVCVCVCENQSVWPIANTVLPKYKNT